MASRYGKYVPYRGPKRIQGWLRVWDVNGLDCELSPDTQFSTGPPAWSPQYCVLRTDEQTIKHQAVQNETTPISPRSMTKVICGKEEFEKHYGIELPSSTAPLSPSLDLSSRSRGISRTNTTPAMTSTYSSADSSYDRAVEHDRRGSVPSSGSWAQSGLPLSPSDDVSDKTSISSSYSESRSGRKSGGLKSQFIRRARSITKLDKKRNAVSSSLSSKASGSVQDMSGWSYVAPTQPSPSLSSSTLPSYRCATTNSSVVMGGDTPGYARNASMLGRLKRSLSLTRLTKKRSRSRISETDDEATALYDKETEGRPVKLQSARSCESLLVTGGRILSVDLGEGQIQVLPLHRSMLGEENCIQLTSSSGSSTFYSCRNSEERSQWLNHLRKSVNPGEEQMRRSDVSLKIWIQEAKNCTSKKAGYYCEISLDKALYARTSTKNKSDMLFWGEQFDFDNLPSIKTITVTLHREADKKKKRDKSSQIGYITIPVSELTSRQLHEKWHTLSPVSLVTKSNKESKSELAQIRLKIRYQTVDILPLSSYNSLLKYLKCNYQSLVERLEPQLSVRAKDDIASSLVHILQREQLARRFLCDTVISEVPKHENLNLMLRGNTIATKAIESYMKLVGNKYLHDTLEDFIRLILDSEDSCEVDPGKLQNNSMLQRNQCNLISYCEMVWGRIINSHSYFPSELRDVFTSFRRQCEHMKKTEVSDNLISACIFLRFLCPAIMSPSLFGLCQELPEERQSRNFTLVAKTLQSLANFTKFGTKEDYMLFMNEFVEREWNQMQNFLKQVSSSDHSHALTQFEGYIDCGKHLSLLHSQLTENLADHVTEDAKSPSGQLPSADNKFADIRPILADLTQELCNDSTPTTGESKNKLGDSPGSISSHQSGVRAPGSTRPESDEYVELSRDNSRAYPPLVQMDFSENIQTPHSSVGRELHLMSSKGLQAGNSKESHSSHLTQHSSQHSKQQRPSLVIGQDPPTTTAQQMVTLARLPERPKDPDADVSNRSDSSDTMRSTSSSGSRKIVRHRVWDRVLTANDLVNGDYIDLISYMDEAHSSPQHTGAEQAPANSHGLAPAPTIPPQAPPNHHNEADNVSDRLSSDTLECEEQTVSSVTLDTAGVPSNVLPSKQQPLAFVNPAFKHSTSNMMSPRRSSDNQSTPEFTPLPNKFNSLNLRGRNKKMEVRSGVTSPQTLRKFHHKDHAHTAGASLDHPHTTDPSPDHPGHTVGGPQDHAHTHSSSLDLPQTHSSSLDLAYSRGGGGDSAHPPKAENAVSSDNSGASADSYRDEKRYGCARFPTMELYPESSVRPQPDGSNSYDLALGQPPSEHMYAGPSDRPNTPSSNASWAGSQMSLNSQQTGINNLQRSIDETSKVKQKYEAEVTVLRTQLSEAQSRLSGTETRLAYQAEQTNNVMEEWKVRLDESEERLRAQQHEKDEQIKNIIERLLAIEEDLRQEQQEMKSAISRKEQIIESQERRIRELDSANNKLQRKLEDMKEHMQSRPSKGSAHSRGSGAGGKSGGSAAETNKTYKTTLYVNDYHSSFC